MMNRNNVEVLNSLYKNTSMGVSSLEKIIPRVNDKGLKLELQKQLSVYNRRNTKLKQALYACNASPKDISPYQKVSADIGVAINTMMDNSPSHIAKMMIQGTNMGIIDINEMLNRHSSMDNEVRNNALAVLKTEQKYLDNLKKFL